MNREPQNRTVSSCIMHLFHGAFRNGRGSNGDLESLANAPTEEFHHQNGWRSEGIVLGKSQSAPVPQSSHRTTHSIQTYLSYHHIIISHHIISSYHIIISYHITSTDITKEFLVLSSLNSLSSHRFEASRSMTIHPRKVSPESVQHCPKPKPQIAG